MVHAAVIHADEVPVSAPIGNRYHSQACRKIGGLSHKGPKNGTRQIVRVTRRGRDEKSL